MIQFEVEDNTGHKRSIAIPENINLSLMEVLKASDYPVEATCGGMALCATCYVEVIQGLEQLPGPTNAELDMLDTLPFAMPNSRLACQIKVTPRLQNVLFRFKN